jgi:hypothetical protein
MCYTGKPNRKKQGVGSLIGATFLALVLISGFMFYALILNITEQYNATISSMNETDWNRSREKVIIQDVKVTNANDLNLTVENQGPIQSHLVWLGIFNKTATPEHQQFYTLDEYVEPAESNNIVSDFSITKGKKYDIQLITELGNVIENRFYPACETKCSLTLVAAPPTVYVGNNVTLFLTVTHNDTEVDTVQDLAVNLQTTPPGLVQLVDNSSLIVQGLKRGESTFFWWVFNATNTGTVTFNATYLQAPSGTYALFTVEIASPPTQEDLGHVEIIGTNCTASFSPTQWMVFGGTTNVSGSVSDLANDDASYLVFRSYSSGSMTNITLLDDGFEGVDWDENWDQYEVTDWFQTTFQAHSGTRSASGTASSTTLTSDNLNASGATHLHVEFWFMKDDIENNEFRLYYWDGSQYDFIQDLDLLGLDDVWIRYMHDVTDDQYFREDFHIRFACTPMTGGENVWVDDVLIRKQVGTEEYTAEVEFVGLSNIENWSKLLWQIDSAWDVTQVTVTIQFFNFTLGDFAPGGNGYTSYISSSTPNIDELKSQSIDSNPNDFKNSTGHWQVKIKGVKATSTQFLMKIDWINFETTYLSAGDSIPYNAWQWYKIRATTASGDPIPYAYVSIYANGTSVAFRNATDKTSILNPAWVRLNANGEFQLEIRSTSGSAETFILYAVVGTTMDQKIVTQEAP